MASAKRTADDVDVKRFVRALPVKFRPGPRKTHEVVHVEVSAVYSSSSGFPGPADNIPTVEYKIVKKDAPSNLRELTSKDDHKLSAS